MKKVVVSSLFLLSQIALNGMSTKKEESCVARTMNEDIKNDISYNDPKAFDKISKYADILLKEFHEQTEPLKASGKLSVETIVSLQESSEMLKTMKHIDPNELTKESQQIPEHLKKQIVDLWNQTKTASVQTIEVMKEVNQKK